MNVRARWRILLTPALMIVCIVLALGRGEAWQYLSLAGLFLCWMADALWMELPAAARCVRSPRDARMLVLSAADAVFSAALSRAMSAMPARHLRTPGAFYGAELVAWLLPVFVLTGVMLWLWWIFRQTVSRSRKALWLLTLIMHSGLSGMAFCAAFVGSGVRPAVALGGVMLLVSAGVEAAHSAVENTEEGLADMIEWTTRVLGTALLAMGIAGLY